jgi:GGDEF domain-containing protein
MSQQKPTNTILDSRALIDLAIACQQAIVIEDVVTAVAREVLSKPTLNALVMVIPDGESGFRCYRATHGVIGPKLNRRIGTQLGHLMDDVTGRSVPRERLRIADITLGHNADKELILPNALWSVDIGPFEAPTGILAVFGQNADDVSASDMIQLRNIGELLGATIKRVHKNDIERSTYLGAEDDRKIIYFRIGHLDAIREVFGRDQADRLKADVTDRISETIPAACPIAPIGTDGIAVIVESNAEQAQTLIARCLKACRSLEVAEKVIVNIVATSTNISIAQPLEPKAVQVSAPFDATQDINSQEVA